MGILGSLFSSGEVEKIIRKLQEQGRISVDERDVVKKSGEKAIPIIMRILKSDSPHNHVHFGMSAVDLLASIGEPAIPALVEILSLQLGNMNLAFSASAELRQMGSKAVPALMTALNEKRPDFRLRDFALRTLANMESDAKDAVPDLLKLAQEKEWRSTALEVLQRIQPGITVELDSSRSGTQSTSSQKKLKHEDKLNAARKIYKTLMPISKEEMVEIESFYRQTKGGPWIAGDEETIWEAFCDSIEEHKSINNPEGQDRVLKFS